MRADVSIVMPVCNTARYIADTIQSVLDQTCSTFELIISDDGTTDDSLKIASTFNDSRIKVLPHPHTGISGAMNRGIRASTAQFIAPLAADDLLTPTSLERRLAAIGPHDLVCGQAVRIHPETTLQDALHTATIYTPKRLRYFYGPTILLRRDIFQRYGLFDENLALKMDREMWVRLFGRNRQRTDRATFTCLGDVVGCYRVRPDSVQQRYKHSPDADKQPIIDAFNAAVDMREHIVDTTNTLFP